MNRVDHLSDIYALVRGRHGLFLANRNDSYIGRSLIEYGEYCPEEWNLLAQLCGPGRVVIEVGANNGTLTVPISKAVGAKGRVIAIEPQPFVHQNLCANLALNSLANVTTYQCGCGSVEGSGSVPMVDYRQPGNFGSVPLAGGSAENSIPVKVEPLDSLFIGKALNLIKIDVEGMEAEVLAGARNIIERFNPVLYLENDRVEKSKELIEMIWNLDYRAWWHESPLYSRNNYFENEQNVFDEFGSINMLCIPRKYTSNVRLPEVTDSSLHPLSS